MLNLMVARKKRKLTQKELAKRVGTNNIKISRIENGIDMPKADLLKKLADELEVSMEYLLLEVIEEEIEIFRGIGTL